MPHDQSDIVMKCDRTSLLNTGILGPLIVALCVVILIAASGLSYRGPYYYPGMLAAIVGIPLFTFFWISTVYRFIRPSPTLIFSHAGITDNASLVAYGAGFIPWDEVAALRCYTYRAAWYSRSRQYLAIVPKDPARAWSHRNPLTRLLVAVTTLGSPTRIKIHQRMLSQPIPDVLTQVAKQYHHELYHNGVVVRPS